MALLCPFPAHAQDTSETTDESTPQKEIQVPETSAPTILTPPPVLPSFYNNPVFAENREIPGRSLSAVFAVCGDGVYDPGEECDDGNREDGDGCSSLCRLEDIAACGNGTVNPGETCDDGNVADGDSCSATCQSEGSCGDGNLDPGEQCDDGNTAIGDGCSSKCVLEVSAKEKKENPFAEVSPSPDAKKEKLTASPSPSVSPSPTPSASVETVEGDNGTKTEYLKGRGVTVPPGCLATCTVAREYRGDKLVREFEVLGDRQITGGTYVSSDGEFDCRTGRPISVSSNSLQTAAEEIADGNSATVVSCSL
jgi:cysteine-rich repeat protein